MAGDDDHYSKAILESLKTGNVMSEDEMLARAIEESVKQYR